MSGDILLDIAARLFGFPKPRTGRFRIQSNTPSAWRHASHDKQGKNDVRLASERRKRVSLDERSVSNRIKR